MTSQMPLLAFYRTRVRTKKKKKIEKVNVIGDMVKNNNNFEKPVQTTHATDYTHPQVSLSGNDSSRRAGADASSRLR